MALTLYCYFYACYKIQPTSLNDSDFKCYEKRCDHFSSIYFFSTLRVGLVLVFIDLLLQPNGQVAKIQPKLQQKSLC